MIDTMKKLRTLIIFIALLFSINAFGQNTIQVKNVYPNEQWEEWQSDKDAGFNFTRDISDKIRSLLINDMATTGLVVVVGGKVLDDYGNITELSYIASCRKSVLSMLYGKYVENGSVDLNLSLETLGIDDRQKLTKQEKQATLRDILSSRSGVFHPASYSGDDLERAPVRGSKLPGEYFLYSNWDFNVAGEIFETLTGKDIYQALEEDLAIPLQMQDFDRTVQKKEGDLSTSKFAAYPIWLSTRDMARLGHLMLRKGRWQQRQIIPASWIQAMLKTRTPLRDMNFNRRDGLAFGYMWWLWPEVAQKGFKGAYTARGMYGQFITVLPELDMVVAHKTNPIYGRSTSWQNYMKLLALLVEASEQT